MDERLESRAAGISHGNPGIRRAGKFRLVGDSVLATVLLDRLAVAGPPSHDWPNKADDSGVSIPTAAHCRGDAERCYLADKRKITSVREMV